MRRTHTTPSPRHHASGSTRQRVAAVLGLLALGFLLGHVHPDLHAETNPDAAPIVSDDAAHHEHSSRNLVDTAPCVGCRSFDEKPFAPARPSTLVPIEPHARALPERSDAKTCAPFAGLPATRAPPIA